jgi:hypothetical protein
LSRPGLAADFRQRGLRGHQQRTAQTHCAFGRRQRLVEIDALSEHLCQVIERRSHVRMIDRGLAE